MTSKRPYELLELNADERGWIDHHLEMYRELTESAVAEADEEGDGDDDNGGEEAEAGEAGGFDHLGFLDQLLLEWRESPEDERADANVIVNMAGIVLGNMLTAIFRLRWAGYKDNDGTDLCLATEPGVELNGEAVDFTLFPISSVAKRLDSDEDHPIARFFIGVMDMLDEKAPGLRREGMEAA